MKVSISTFRLWKKRLRAINRRLQHSSARDPNSWILSVRARVLRFLISRHESTPIITEEELAKHRAQSDGAWGELAPLIANQCHVDPCPAPPRTRSAFRSRLREIHFANRRTQRRCRWC